MAKEPKKPETVEKSNMVSKFNLTSKVNSFHGGQLLHHLKEWKTLTRDPNILSIISGDDIKFIEHPPVQYHVNNAKFTSEEQKMLKSEIEKLLLKGVIIKSNHENKEFVSPIFTTRKNDGGIRIILNLKKLNKSVKYVHFKMSSIKTVLKMITKDCYMASIDLKDAYYSVPIQKAYQNI